MKQQNAHAKAERITNASEEKIGVGWKSLKTKAQNTRSIFENQKGLKAKLTFNILKTKIVNNKSPFSIDRDFVFSGSGWLWIRKS